MKRLLKHSLILGLMSHVFQSRQPIEESDGRLWGVLHIHDKTVSAVCSVLNHKPLGTGRIAQSAMALQPDGALKSQCFLELAFGK